eukprot:CAMPEP_0178373444 /NCGR_PEP_ID=MMETSP0689_2-20121128/1866_1 /TAXON_ID=160604 /ORGANISM="Amphidinium massartii, Strain CS-259" /LENGTH=1645 /DNA_ID=CAMNT_0019993387 /DNA_START=79 /DNA_END=5017 /DNA_ORIENTATION=+
MAAGSAYGGIGGYVVGFTVHEGRELTRDGSAIDPVCIVRCQGNEYSTELKYGKESHVKFEESFIWSDIQMNEIEFCLQEFELQAANIFTRNDIVGSNKVQLSMVRNRPNHSFVKKDLQLSNELTLTAKLQVTVFCYGPGDEPPRPDDLENDTEQAERQMDDLGAAVLNTVDTSEHKDAVSYNLFLQVHRAEHLGGGEKLFNPLLSLDFGGHLLNTPVAKQTHSLSWDECFRVPVTTPLFSDAIVVQVLDKKDWGGEDIIVQGRLSFSTLRTQALQPRWFSFYGFSADELPDATQLEGLHEDPEENTYQGRLMISARVHKVSRPSDLLPPALVRGQLLDEPACSHTTFLCDIIKVSGCPGTDVYAQLSIQRTSKTSKKVKRDTGVGSTDPATPGTFSFPTEKGRILPFTGLIPTEAAQQTDLILSIFAKGVAGSDKYQRVGFLRIKPASIRELRSGVCLAPKWFCLKPMAHLPSHVEPGSVLCTIFRAPREDVERPPRMVRIVPMQLRCYVVSGRKFTSPGKEQPNSFVQVECGGLRAETKVMYRSTAPVWQQCIKLDVDLMCSSTRTARVLYPEPIKITVFDKVASQSLAEEAQSFVDDSAKALAAAQKELQKGGDVVKAVGKLEKGLGTAVAGKEAKKQSDLEKIRQEEGAGFQRAVADAAASLQDQFSATQGDVLAQKRLGATAQGKRVVGRVSLHFSELTGPPSSQAGAAAKGAGKGKKGRSQSAFDGVVKPRWIRIRGGVTGSAHTGDLLLGFELMKVKYADAMPELSCHPPTHDCTLSVSLMGLRNILPPLAANVRKDLKRPYVHIYVPSFGGEGASQTVSWKKKPQVSLGTDDYNRRWNGAVEGTTSFEYLEVVHMKAQLPRQRVWEPQVRFGVYDDQGDTKAFIGEGLMNLEDVCPWMKGKKNDTTLESTDVWSEDDSDDDSIGVPISDDEDDHWQGGAEQDQQGQENQMAAAGRKVDVKAGLGGGRLVPGASVQLNGLPTQLMQEIVAWSEQPRPKSCCPTPGIDVPHVESFLNYFSAKGNLLDVRGPIKQLLGDDDDDETPAADQNRPLVPGKLEDHLPPTFFKNVPLQNGQQEAGYAKLAVRVVSPPDENWPMTMSAESGGKLDKVEAYEVEHFIPEQFRKKYKRDQPHVLRARVYVIRGINVSGAKRGFGDPYLWFMYGRTPVELRGHVQKQTTEPRFFKVDEKDIQVPEEMILQVGMKDFQSNGQDLLIGGTTIDLEDRFYDMTWQKAMRMNKIPIEYRPLGTGDSQFKFRGSVEMWVELIDAARAAEIPANVLMMPPAAEVEIRIVLMTCRDISLRLCVDPDTHVAREMVDVIGRCQLDCKSYAGQQTIMQETDIHYSSEGEGEFQWRFVWSRVSVTKGVPLDCQLQLSLWEHFTLASPQMLCEALIEMKNYCRKVAATGDTVELDAEIPMNNPKLTHLLAEEEGENTYIHGYDEFKNANEYDTLVGQAVVAGMPEPTDDAKTKHAAGFAKINLQIWPQPEAAMSENTVGLGREEPNRLPVVKYPATGRNWKATLPGVAGAVSAVQNAVRGKWMRMKVVMGIMFILVLLVIPFLIKDSNTGCPLAMNSCVQGCTCCAVCRNSRASPSSLCYHLWQNSATCTSKLGCNCADTCASDNEATACTQSAEALSTAR